MAEKAYFKKVVLTTKVKLSSGKDIPWENVGWNIGVLATEDSKLIKELSAFSKEGKGGVLSITEADYTELKKNLPQPSRPLKQLQVSAPEPKLRAKPADSAKSSSPAAAVAPESKVEKVDQPVTAKGVFANEASA
jgi:hypothetical protein